MLTRWVKACQNFHFTVKHISRKLNVVADTIARLFGALEAEHIPRTRINFQWAIVREKK